MRPLGIALTQTLRLSNWTSKKQKKRSPQRLLFLVIELNQRLVADFGRPRLLVDLLRRMEQGKQDECT